MKQIEIVYDRITTENLTNRKSSKGVSKTTRNKYRFIRLLILPLLKSFGGGTWNVQLFLNLSDNLNIFSLRIQNRQLFT